MNNLQELIDALAAELGRPVLIGDRHWHQLAYSTHAGGHVDEVRIESLLRRESPADVASWLELLQLQDAEWFARVPANPSFSMEERVCVPVRWQNLVLGYLWLIDAPRRLSTDEIQAALRCASEAGLLLYRLRLLESADRARERELVHQLLSGAEADREGAARQLVEGGFLEPDSSFTVVVLQASHAGLPLLDHIRVLLTDSLEQARRGLPPHGLATYIADSEVVAVLVCQSGADLAVRLELLFDKARASLALEDGWEPIVGAGNPRSSLADAYAAYREAGHAARLATTIPTLGPIAPWSSLGAYRTISALIDGAAPGIALPESLERLLASPESDVLVLTLDSYLEHAGDAQSAAAALFVHRSTLYNRLRRVEQIAEVDLRSGDARLELQLGLRLWRMSR